MWDEFPLMLYNLRKREGADKAIQLLDTLRYLRATYPRLRFLFTGSIGLHLALKSLRAEGNANSPFNDVQTELVPPLSEADAAALIANLCDALRHKPEEPGEIADRASALLGGFAYHIHHCFDQLDQLGRSATATDVDAAVETVATGSTDPAHIGYTGSRPTTRPTMPGWRWPSWMRSPVAIRPCVSSNCSIWCGTSTPRQTSST